MWLVGVKGAAGNRWAGRCGGSRAGDDAVREEEENLADILESHERASLRWMWWCWGRAVPWVSLVMAVEEETSPPGPRERRPTQPKQPQQAGNHLLPVHHSDHERDKPAVCHAVVCIDSPLTTSPLSAERGTQTRRKRQRLSANEHTIAPTLGQLLTSMIENVAARPTAFASTARLVAPGLP